MSKEEKKIIEEMRDTYGDMILKLDSMTNPKDLEQILFRVQCKHQDKIPNTSIEITKNMMQLSVLLGKFRLITYESFIKLKHYLKDCPDQVSVVEKHQKIIRRLKKKLKGVRQSRKRNQERAMLQGERSDLQSTGTKRQVTCKVKLEITIRTENMDLNRTDQLNADIKACIAQYADIPVKVLTDFETMQGSIIIIFGIKERTPLEESALSIATRIRDGFLNGSLVLKDKASNPIEIQLQSVKIWSVWTVDYIDIKEPNSNIEINQVQKGEEREGTERTIKLVQTTTEEKDIAEDKRVGEVQSLKRPEAKDTATQMAPTEKEEQGASTIPSESEKRTSRCEHHNGHNISGVCSSCGNVPVCDQCISYVHPKHTIKQLSAVTKSIKQTLKDMGKHDEKLVIDLKSHLKDIGCLMQELHSRGLDKQIQALLSDISEIEEDLDVEFEKRTEKSYEMLPKVDEVSMFEEMYVINFFRTHR